MAGRLDKHASCSANHTPQHTGKVSILLANGGGSDSLRIMRKGQFLKEVGVSILTALLLSGVAAVAQSRIYETNVYVETIAGSGFYGYLDGQGTQTMFYNPTVTVVDPATNVYVWDSYNSRIRKITPDGTVTTLAGNGTASISDGQGTNAYICSIQSMIMGADGNIWFSDRVLPVVPFGKSRFLEPSPP